MLIRYQKKSDLITKVVKQLKFNVQFDIFIYIFKLLNLIIRVLFTYVDQQHQNNALGNM